jgi:hypothetical protein
MVKPPSGLALVVMVASCAVAMACTITLGRPKRHVIGVNGEVFAGIGVPQDCNAPLTVADLSAGRAPGVDKPLELLKA